MIKEIAEEVNKLCQSVMEEILQEVTKELEDFGNPEKLIGKPFEQWTPQDMQLLGRIYGDDPNNPLSKLIFNRMYQNVLEKEKQL